MLLNVQLPTLGKMEIVTYQDSSVVLGTFSVLYYFS